MNTNIKDKKTINNQSKSSFFRRIFLIPNLSVRQAGSKFYIRNKSGFSIIELLVYVAVLIFMIFVVFSTISVTRNAYRTVKATRIMHASALSLFDRIGNEVRSAYDINLANSSLANDSGSLALTKDNGGANETKFYIDTGVVVVSDDSIPEGSLTSAEMTINSLRFDVYDNTLSKLVSVVFNASVSIGDYTYNKEFRNSYVLRGGY